MRRRDRLLAILAVLLLVGSVKVGQQIYRWYAFAEERTQIGELDAQLRDAALGVIDTQIGADSLRIEIERIDEDLADRRADLDRRERHAMQLRITRSLEQAYRGALVDYNERVAERNELFRRWRARVDQNHRDVDRYNLLADSIRGLAARIGEPYYPVLSPAEIAQRYGLLDTMAAPR